MKSRKGMNIFLVELPVGVGPGSSGRFVLVRQLLEDENFRAPVKKKKKKKIIWRRSDKGLVGYQV